MFYAKTCLNLFKAAAFFPQSKKKVFNESIPNIFDSNL